MAQTGGSPWQSFVWRCLSCQVFGAGQTKADGSARAQAAIICTDSHGAARSPHSERARKPPKSTGFTISWLFWRGELPRGPQLVELSVRRAWHGAGSRDEQPGHRSLSAWRGGIGQSGFANLACPFTWHFQAHPEVFLRRALCRIKSHGELHGGAAPREISQQSSYTSARAPLGIPNKARGCFPPKKNTFFSSVSVQGYRQKDSYIASQGPLQHTIEDFWRMIWEWKSCSIVMLTELEERGQVKARPGRVRASPKRHRSPP